VESGLPVFTDVAWLTVAPTAGRVRPDRTRPLAITVDTTGLRAGRHDATVVVTTNDPGNPVLTIPVRVRVPRHQRTVNVGGPAVAFPDGVRFSRDRRWQPGSYGWDGTTTVRTVAGPVTGTTRDAVFRSQREGPMRYRFTVPDGRYRVGLGFAELVHRDEFARVMDIGVEGRRVVDNLDVAGLVGRRHALRRSTVVDVTDGTLDVRLQRAFGSPPVLDTIQVTWLGPPGG
jgi:hypothetical protein